ncbi:N4-gp56 family major capsid protein [Salipaludibacillus agaradhaerens]|jgi:N4-gp56 family major capsid protein|uniref:N4-gp56 family major capsid protein n=1 Tax=Salipaludibacillus agaradhaerens TaxID=76935 RepID=A0A9Q4FZL6_SALAG|nr:N4-gp56 family major capsid protein [Salipaludibacillus agaradhaerens]MCR6096859.1 N4-gp56 family major capsid protein [Salipaludibacillus agaradhaerens]MCR6116703.1 N4-gp56 family major capsid protein [Salipaludibacillus agaradhaerens]
MAQTQMQHMIDPEVLADMISASLPNAIRFSPLARMDTTLQGTPGTTVTVPRFKYIGDAQDLAEGASVDLSLLETDTEQFTIKKIAKGAELTDEAVLSGYGDPMGEAANQMALSIANKVDNDVLDALDTTTIVFDSATDTYIEAVDGAQGVFNEEDQSAMVLIVHPADAAKLRKDAGNNFTRASDLGDSILVNGAFGEVLGAQIVRSRKVTEGEAYLVKEGALAIYMKRGVQVETDRDITAFTTVMTASQHYGAHLYDESKAIKIEFNVGGGEG